MLIEELLELTVKEKASDLHISANLPPVLRVSGNLVRTEYPPLTPEEVEALLFPMLSNEQRRTLEQVWELDMSYGIHGLGRFRVNIYKDKGNYAAAFRTINSVAPKFEELGLPPIVRKITERPRGLILVTGPTGSGKSTTLNAVLTSIRTSELNFMTLEDPVEYKLAGISQVQVKPAIGLTFAAGLRSFLRQDPDVILVGEVRDNETAEACLKAALTGHLVLSTLHTNDALGAVPRLIDMGMEPFLLASSLALVAAQRLIRILCPYCKVPHIPDSATLDRIIREGHLNPRDANSWTFFKSVGCPRCFGTGFSGRRAIYEVYRTTEEMRNIIYKTQDLIALRKAAVASGALNLRANGWRKVIRGLTTVDEILSITTADE